MPYWSRSRSDERTPAEPLSVLWFAAMYRRSKPSFFVQYGRTSSLMLNVSARPRFGTQFSLSTIGHSTSAIVRSAPAMSFASVPLWPVSTAETTRCGEMPVGGLGSRCGGPL